ncbi:hypothetical protein EW146_g2727 [Bondarzewia mesenterica]|uniref:Fungal lipase-type domain-containing protein n=1 Tax=Bondarzewia mesenterica TaxID=1095465 RepID=A0A4S4M020_9AGAM|nr:hypothetical protein EW146_g2727 [Bondarzewia mesenterica]
MFCGPVSETDCEKIGDQSGRLHTDYSKTFVDPIRQVVPCSTLRGFTEEYGDRDQDVLLPAGELDLGRTFKRLARFGEEPSDPWCITIWKLWLRSIQGLHMADLNWQLYMSSTHSISQKGSLSTATAFGASGKVCASTQSGRGSQNFAAVLGAFVRAFENGEISLPHVKEVLYGLAVSLDEEGGKAVDLSFTAALENWKSMRFRAGPNNAALIPYVHCAVWGAAEVYSLQTQAAISSFKNGARALLDAQPAELIDASPSNFLRNTKNWALFKDEATGALCLSVRGTATSGFFESLVDNMTNIDANAYEATLLDGKNEDSTPFPVHRGFLDVARAMYSDVKTAIARASDSASVLIFTGHSAGGGTAFLLYHLLHATDISLFNQSGHPTDRVISFVNLNDPVPRADLAYALWVANSLGKYLTQIANNAKLPAYLPLPPQVLFPDGEMVLLDDDGDAAAKLTPDVLIELAFLDLQAHGKKEYVRIVQSVFSSPNESSVANKPTAMIL